MSVEKEVNQWLLFPAILADFSMTTFVKLVTRVKQLFPSYEVNGVHNAWRNQEVYLALFPVVVKSHAEHKTQFFHLRECEKSADPFGVSRRGRAQCSISCRDSGWLGATHGKSSSKGIHVPASWYVNFAGNDPGTRQLVRECLWRASKNCKTFLSDPVRLF